MKSLLAVGLILAELTLLAFFLPALAPASPQPPLTGLVWLLAMILIPLPLIGLFILWKTQKAK